MLSMSECGHILLYLMVGYLSVDLCRTDIAVSEYLAERFHRNTIGKAYCGRKGVASHVKGQRSFHPDVSLYVVYAIEDNVGSLKGYGLKIRANK